jgi:hypothetical protein
MDFARFWGAWYEFDSKMIGRSSRPLTVQLPPESSDRPSWVKVGAIAIIGFTVGVVWPRLAGIRPGPSAPGDATASAASGMRAPDAPLSSSSSPAETAAAAATTASAAGDVAAVPLNNAPPAILVTHGVALSCKTTEGESLKGQACGGPPAFDGLAQPRLKRLAHCPGAQGLSGKLAVVFSLDFTRNKINFSFGKTSTVANKDTLDQCLRMSLENVSLNAVPHDNPLYAMYYSVTFTPRDSVAASSPAGVGVAAGGSGASSAANGASGNGGGGVLEPESPAGTAQVGWEVAIVRDTPRTGQVVARLQRGTKVRVGNGQDGWYRVQFGNDFGSEGWVYRGAIGR